MMTIGTSTSDELAAKVHPEGKPIDVPKQRLQAAAEPAAATPLPLEMMQRIMRFLDDRSMVRMRATCRANNYLVVGHSNFYASHLMSAFLGGNE